MDSKKPGNRLASWSGSAFNYIRTLIRSSGVGVIATISDQLMLLILISVFGMDEFWANFPSMVPGLVFIYIGNKYFAFEDFSKENVKKGSLFLIIEFGAFLLNLLLYDLLLRYILRFDEHWNPHIARAIGTFVTYMGFSFPLWSLYVFQKTPKENEQEEATEEQESATETPVEEGIKLRDGQVMSRDGQQVSSRDGQITTRDGTNQPQIDIK